jgi:hypothetical protein
MMTKRPSHPPGGGTVSKTNVVLNDAAMLIGQCEPGQKLSDCFIEDGAYGDFTERCTAGSSVGVELVCYANDCRPFKDFSPKTLVNARLLKRQF